MAKVEDIERKNITGGSVIAPNATTEIGQMAANTYNISNSSKSPNKIDTSGEANVAQGNLCATTTPDRNNLTASGNETTRYFDIDYASKTFEESMADKNAISLHHYLNGFKELMK